MKQLTTKYTKYTNAKGLDMLRAILRGEIVTFPPSFIPALRRIVNVPEGRELEAPFGQGLVPKSPSTSPPPK